VRQRNTWPWPVDVPEYRDDDGVIWPATGVDGGAVIDRPTPLVGFTPEPEAAPEPPPAKPTKKAAAPATPETEG
jgi:hypothetical protein